VQEMMALSLASSSSLCSAAGGAFLLLSRVRYCSGGAAAMLWSCVAGPVHWPLVVSAAGKNLKLKRVAATTAAASSSILYRKGQKTKRSTELVTIVSHPATFCCEYLSYATLLLFSNVYALGV